MAADKKLPGEDEPLERGRLYGPVPGGNGEQQYLGESVGRKGSGTSDKPRSKEENDEIVRHQNASLRSKNARTKGYKSGGLVKMGKCC